MFIDEAKIYVKGGDGGNGCVSIHREYCNPRGGPDGGNGGRGGSVILEGSRSLNTLLPFRKKVHFKAQRGSHGQGNNKSGKDGEDLIVYVPLGTVVYDASSGKLIGDIIKEGSRIVVAKGGRGGRGNAAFATANYRVPRFAERGEKGEERWIKLELRSIAHVGIVGMPNAGKSTFLSMVSRAKPKIADYPFTTLHPHLGVVKKDEATQYIFADIPGLIEGASKGSGLGHRFLRHITRTKVLLHIIDVTMVDPKDPLDLYHKIMKELEEYDLSLLDKPMVVAANKTDIPGTEEGYFALEDALKKQGMKCFPISAARGEGLDEVLKEIFKILQNMDDDFSIPLSNKDMVVVDEFTENIEPVRVIREGEKFRILGKSPERMAYMLDLYNEEALHYFQQCLRRMGVEEKLEELGAKDGDTVVVGDFEFDYFSDKIY